MNIACFWVNFDWVEEYYLLIFDCTKYVRMVKRTTEKHISNQFQLNNNQNGVIGWNVVEQWKSENERPLRYLIHIERVWKQDFSTCSFILSFSFCSTPPPPPPLSLLLFSAPSFFWLAHHFVVCQSMSHFCRQSTRTIDFRLNASHSSILHHKSLVSFRPATIASMVAQYYENICVYVSDKTIVCLYFD